MKVKDIKIGFKFNHGTKGEGIIIAATPRTLTAKFKICITKVRYYKSDADFSISDF